nr:MAG TPA: hypothetical protein [Caudoviricetes sp.]DAO08137.1 MAG TPA: hypothetical protein [Bacteriophage sp.]
MQGRNRRYIFSRRHFHILDSMQSYFVKSLNVLQKHLHHRLCQNDSCILVLLCMD